MELPQAPAEEIHLRRLTVDEALWRLDRYLNDSFIAGVPRIRVIHGKGTGTLRQAVREALESSPMVKSFRPAGLEEGGNGATIVELANQIDQMNHILWIYIPMTY